MIIRPKMVHDVVKAYRVDGSVVVVLSANVRRKLRIKSGQRFLQKTDPDGRIILEMID